MLLLFFRLVSTVYLSFLLASFLSLPLSLRASHSPLVFRFVQSRVLLSRKQVSVRAGNPYSMDGPTPGELLTVRSYSIGVTDQGNGEVFYPHFFL